jgi:hypothetical protein
MIAAEADRQGPVFEIEREGSNHTIYRLGTIRVPVPRHGEVGSGLTEAILKECEPVLGRRWWK